jgi:subtilisin family serine protease
MVADSSNGMGATRARRTGRHIVLLRDGLGRRGAQALHRLAGLHVDVSSDREGRMRRPQPVTAGEGMLFHGTGTALVHADGDQLAALATRTGNEVVGIEPERVVHAIQLNGGTDASVGASVASQDTWGLQTTRVTASRFTGRGIRIAILDTGLDLKHPDFRARSIVSESFVAGAGVDDGNGHGTYCAGLACGPASPAQSPRYGVAVDADLYVGKVIADNGHGTDGDILAGIDWAVRNGCAIVSLSVGSPVAAQEPYSAIYEQVAHRALAAGTLILAPAGNDSLRPDAIAPVDHPANCPSILAIAAVDPYLRIAPFSCGGINAEGGEVDLAAPGVAVRSSWRHPDLYRTDSGTSMAVPFAAGIAALFAEAKPCARGRDLKALLMSSAQPLPLPVRDVGAGLVLAP